MHRTLGGMDAMPHDMYTAVVDETHREHIS